MTARGHKPTKRGSPPAPSGADFDDAPTELYDSGTHKPAQPQPAPHQSSPMIAISMKTPADPNIPRIKMPEREMPHVKLRAMSEVAPARQPQNLGNLAPPYDPRAARQRSMRDYVVWGCLAVILASAVALVVWFVAG